MKNSKSDARSEFHLIIRPIEGTTAYAVVLGEIRDGQFAPTDFRPQCCSCDWDEVKPNPLAPGHFYVLASDLYTLFFDVMAHFDNVAFVSDMLVFTVKDFPVCYEKSTEKDEE